MRLRSLDVLDVARGQTRSAPGPTSRSLLDAASASAACACRIGRTSAYLTKRPIRAGRQSRPEHPQPYPCDVREPKIGPQKRRLYPRPVQHVLSWLDAPGVRRPCKAVMPDTATALLIEVQVDGLARERVLSAQLYSANEPLLVPKTSSRPGTRSPLGRRTLLGHNPATGISFRLTLG
jgi:hypothetical protein